MKIFSTSINALEKGIQYAGTKHKVISHNIANVDTPNYKQKVVNPTFKEIYNGAMHATRTDTRHREFSATSKQAYSINNTSHSFSHNGNNVDIDKEMSDLAENQIYYYTMIDQLNGKFQSLQSVIKGGRA
ncbi:flagellar basal body rod protein FlgB [Sutcliffiella halmapala]|uniref:flagellar basal body rod protein FlgB n=1 Tax=Sutcliffiella halmapala TaxID=79882 RepID=UPI0009949201|nr:flagellar basal body rod protein FlgB [Sutcliffiella halmapala]